MTQHDFKAALEDFQSGEYIPQHDGSYVAVIAALRIADRLQSGEPSEEMWQSGIKAKEATFADITPIYNAMTQQLIKECE